MEIGNSAVTAGGAHERSPMQQKLTQIFCVAKKSSFVGEVKSTPGAGMAPWSPQREAGLRRLPPNLALEKPEPEEGVRPPRVAVSPRSRRTQASTLLASTLDQNLNPLAPPSLQRVKRELLSPSSCVTIDTEGAVSNSVESLAAAHAILMRSNKSLHDASAAPHAPDVAGKPFPAAPWKSCDPLEEHPSVKIPVKIRGRFQPLSSANTVKTEPVDPMEKLLTALDMVGTGVCASSLTPPATAPQSRTPDARIVRKSPEAATTTASMKLMTPMHKIPEKLNSKDADVAGAKPSLAPTLAHVKSEPQTLSPALPTERASNHERLHSPRAVASSESDDDSEERAQTVTPIAQTPRDFFKPRNTNPGRRIQGGRVYDSAFGKTCHWCRQKTVEPHVKCRECTIHFCGPCLLNRNGENIRRELREGVGWLCPKCRNGCGPGCENCCNCGPCRKALGKPPTGQLIGVARKAGFDNAHDYLVHLETGESPAEIARRKQDMDWINGGSSWSDSSDGESSASDGSDEFTLNDETSSQLHQGTLSMKHLRKFVQSQKRKSVSMRASFPAKRKHFVPSPVVRRRDVDSIVASLRATGRSLSKEKERAVKSDRVAQKLKSVERSVEDETSIRSRNRGMRTWACKREYVEVQVGSNISESELEASAVAKRRKFNWELPLPFSEVKCEVEPIATSTDVPGGRETSSFSERGARALNGGNTTSSQTMSEQERGIECPIDPQGADYRMKLKFALAQPFDAEELEALDLSVRCRKPVQKQRHMRGRSVDIITGDEGQSYLDHYQDFNAKLEDARAPPEKLALLRGFFFWLQHSSMEGAFAPWPSTSVQSGLQSGDCVESEGPDCQVTAVVLSLDEGNEANNNLMHTFTNTTQTSLPRQPSVSRQGVIPYPVRKNFAQPVKPQLRPQAKVPPVIAYQVVLGLPAPSQSKVW